MTKTELKHPQQEGRKLYERIEGLISDRIRNGTLKPGSRLENIEEIAMKLDVSPGTVRHSLQNLAARGILVRRPRAGTFVADEESRPAASSGGKTSAADITVLLLPDITHPEYAYLARSIQDVSREMKIDVLIGNTDDEIERYEEIIYRQLNNDIYGIVMVPPLSRNLPLELISEIQRRAVPVVTIYRSIPTLGWPTVLTDYYHGLESSARHLCEIGCRNIGFATLTCDIETMHIRHYAFLRALISMGRTPSEELLLTVPQAPLKPGPEYAMEVRQMMRQWLTQHPNMDGICCVHDEVAVGLMEQLEKLGRKVPEDVAVAGCGNYGQYYGLAPHALTTVDTNYTEVARQACGLLTRMRQGESLPEGTKIAVRGELIVGHSTTRPASGKPRSR